MKKIGDYLHLYVHGHTLLLTDIFGTLNFLDTSLYKLDYTKFYSAPGLAWTATLKVTKVQLKLFTDVDILLIVEKGIRRWIFYSVPRYMKANNKYISYLLR